MVEGLHQARVRDVSIRGIARDLGMSRNTVRRYLVAEEPKMVGATRSKKATCDTIQIGAKGHTR